ncbi:MAG: zinc ribbon domain-containing protein [Comamonadaceae bacterium]|nr:MAG: zinc ribbon domain-containing protein [Comamonadaceae bacterium]
MLSQQIRSSGSLLDSLDSIRNWRAALLLLGTFVAMALVFAVGGMLARFSFALFALFALFAYVVLFYGANAAGMMIMDEARGYPSRPMMAAVMTSLATSHRLILVFLLLGVAYLAGFLVLALVLFVCKIPFLGPVLYAVVFPVSVVIAGIAMFALPTVVFPLSAPSVWNGATTMQCVSQLVAIVRRRLLLVLLLMIGVTFIAGLVAFLIGAILFSGTAVTALLSVPILGGGMGGMGMGMGMEDMMGGGVMGMAMGMGAAGGHMVGAAIGGGILFAIAFTLPGLVYLRGACTVYLRAIDGLDMAAEQAAVDAKIAAARDKARAMQAQAQQAASRPAPAPAPVHAPMGFPPAAPAAAPVAPPFAAPAQPVPPVQAVPPVRPPVAPDPLATVGMAAVRPLPVATPPVAAPVAAPPTTAPLMCPSCSAPVAANDMFCGECGHKLI